MMSASLPTIVATSAFAGNPEPLDKEFLDYLSTCEGKDDNWTVVVGEKQRRKAAEKSNPAPPADKAAPKTEDKP